MITYEKLLRNRCAFRSLTGFDRLLFDRLAAQVEQVLQTQRQTHTTRQGQKLRQRRPGA